ncbi:hypothetical protein [Streptomyces syringium]|uniref:hypothetical protein n=1 Tax=Streptomyces syringium TaxID=76729 RepID=UPI003AAFCDF0
MTDTPWAIRSNLNLFEWKCMATLATGLRRGRPCAAGGFARTEEEARRGAEQHAGEAHARHAESGADQ